VKQIEQRYDVFLRASPPGTPLEFVGWTDEFPGLVATADKPERTAAALGATISRHLSAHGVTTLPAPIEHDERALRAHRAHGEGYGRRMAVVRLQVPG